MNQFSTVLVVVNSKYRIYFFSLAQLSSTTYSGVQLYETQVLGYVAGKEEGFKSANITSLRFSFQGFVPSSQSWQGVTWTNRRHYGGNWFGSACTTSFYRQLFTFGNITFLVKSQCAIARYCDLTSFIDFDVKTRLSLKKSPAQHFGYLHQVRLTQPFLIHIVRLGTA